MSLECTELFSWRPISFRLTYNNNVEEYLADIKKVSSSLSASLLNPDPHEIKLVVNNSKQLKDIKFQKVSVIPLK